VNQPANGESNVESSAAPAAKPAPAAKNGSSTTPAAQEEKDKEGPCGLPSKCVVL
jgi:hypothetical protein